MEEEIKFDNTKSGLCVICDKPLNIDDNVWLCLKCNRPSEVHSVKILEHHGNKLLMDIKSDCCTADVKFLGRITCSERCHEKFVSLIEKDFGMFKTIDDKDTGVTYEVPTRDLIEEGLILEDLTRYPSTKKWDDLTRCPSKDKKYGKFYLNNRGES